MILHIIEYVDQAYRKAYHEVIPSANHSMSNSLLLLWLISSHFKKMLARSHSFLMAESKQDYENEKPFSIARYNI